ncbi:MAG TPA: sensor histidine kinase, partial [Pseudonocardiaceae bacterium]|nr:sensor histidine kinase [Pseudonocardiaceae bacterium]
MTVATAVALAIGMLLIGLLGGILIGRRAGRSAVPSRPDGATVAELVQRVVLSSHNGVVLLDRSGDVVLANPPAVELGLVQGSRPDERARKAAEQVRASGEVV